MSRKARPSAFRELGAPFVSAPNARFQIAKGEDLKNIFVGNLDFSVREEAIRSLFEAYGAVERVSIMTDRETGRSRGFAFVEMTNEAEAERAIAALNGTDMSGRALNVNEARPKTDRGPRPGGGGGRGFGGGGFRDREGGGGGGGGGGHTRQRREPRW
jgi:RNA recognition motif-containing protein